MMASLRSWFALLRSIMIYHGNRERHRRMDALYAQFVTPGDLVFDIGAHVGDRVASFRRLGARVVALEPQPGPRAILQFLFGSDRAVTLLREAAAGNEGELPLNVNSRNPTVSTLSDDFVRTAQGAQNWEGQRWDDVISVPTTTLDALIETYGDPAFIKIDVEGYEQAVLSGLTAPVPALSFEFTTIAREVAIACLDRLEAIGDYRYNVSLGETHAFVFPSGVTAEEMRAYLSNVPHVANSGDVYAHRVMRQCPPLHIDPFRTEGTILPSHGSIDTHKPGGGAAMDAMRGPQSHDRSRHGCDARLPLLSGGAALVVLTTVIADSRGSGPVVQPVALASYLLLAGIVRQKIPAYHDHPVFGLANAVTLVRAALNCLLAGLLADAALHGVPDPKRLGWLLFAIGALSLSLDGVDGYLARWQKLESRFGARFDIEVDALLLTLLAVGVLLLGRAGAWVLAIGGFHYAFLVARQFSPMLRRRLPHSMRRKAVCALQGVALLPLLTPLVVPPLSIWIATVALLALAWSFAVDLVWLARERSATGRGVYG